MEKDDALKDIILSYVAVGSRATSREQLKNVFEEMKTKIINMERSAQPVPMETKQNDSTKEDM